MGGPSWEVETGRRDGIISAANEALANLPPPSLDINQLKLIFQQKGLTVRDLVVVSGMFITLCTASCQGTQNNPPPKKR